MKQDYPNPFIMLATIMGLLLIVCIGLLVIDTVKDRLTSNVCGTYTTVINGKTFVYPAINDMDVSSSDGMYEFYAPNGLYIVLHPLNTSIEKVDCV